MWYYVVYFSVAKKHLVVPRNWIYQSKKVLEKFVNNAINANQKHLCYWRNEKNENGEPRGEPNFNAPISNEFSSNNEMCFFGKVKRFFCKYIHKIINIKKVKIIYK